MLRTAAIYLFLVAVTVAAIPYMEFLILPPRGSVGQWALTVAALVTAVALRLFIRQKDEQDRRDWEERCEAERHARMGRN